MIVIRIVGFPNKRLALRKYFNDLVLSEGFRSSYHKFTLHTSSGDVIEPTQGPEEVPSGYVHIIGPKGETVSQLVAAVRGGEHRDINLQVIEELQH
jgi:hypothetical protein